MQAPPECFSLALIGLFFWVETVIVPRSYRFQSLGKFRPAYLDRLRACHSPELFAQHFGQTQVLRREFPSESNSLRDRCGCLFCTRRYRLGNVGRRYIHAGPIRSHRRVRAHPSPLPTLQGVDLRRGIADLYGRAQLSPKTAARYLDAFATVDDTTTLDQLRERLEPPRQCHSRWVPALHPLPRRVRYPCFGNRDLRDLFLPPDYPTTNNRDAVSRPALAANSVRCGL